MGETAIANGNIRGKNMIVQLQVNQDCIKNLLELGGIGFQKP